MYSYTQSTDHQKLLSVRNSAVSDEYMQRSHRNHTMFKENFLNIWKKWVKFQVKAHKSSKLQFCPGDLVTCLGEQEICAIFIKRLLDNSWEFANLIMCTWNLTGGLSWHILVENDYHQWKLKLCSVLCGFQNRTMSTHDVVAWSVI